ncbi:hypothetical protein EJB05_35947 [Eragrostis curvula]|uniref:Uncharacterized protein n=1 Tax=Eragrostis curvula TaxID=38414 RepID=A0A5J9U862_9POAL|nr:hypothetical protein EJB05_35947 [Eragrostis curvula]
MRPCERRRRGSRMCGGKQSTAARRAEGNDRELRVAGGGESCACLTSSDVARPVVILTDQCITHCLDAREMACNGGNEIIIEADFIGNIRSPMSNCQFQQVIVQQFLSDLFFSMIRCSLAPYSLLLLGKENISVYTGRRCARLYLLYVHLAFYSMLESTILRRLNKECRGSKQQPCRLVASSVVDVELMLEASKPGQGSLSEEDTCVAHVHFY